MAVGVDVHRDGFAGEDVVPSIRSVRGDFDGGVEPGFFSQRPSAGRSEAGGEAWGGGDGPLVSHAARKGAEARFAGADGLQRNVLALLVKGGVGPAEIERAVREEEFDAAVAPV